MNTRKSHLKPYRLPLLADEQWAYLAGIFDGEAYIGMPRVKRANQSLEHYDPKIVVAQNDYRLMQYLLDTLQTGRVRDKKMQNVKKPVYDFSITQRLAVYKILCKVRKYMIVKGEAADRVISYIDSAYDEAATHG